MKEVVLMINGKEIRSTEGETILWAALTNDIYIPNLCSIKGTEPFAGCRLCFVEVEGEEEPVASCTMQVREGMVVHTRGNGALRLARTSAQLLLASHPVDCKDCPKALSCELIKIAKHLGLKLRTERFRRFEKQLPIDDSSPVFVYDPTKCVLCGKCVRVCRDRVGVGAIGFIRRGFKRRVSTFEERPLAETGCLQCGECVKTCPVGALSFKAEQNRLPLSNP